jgi:hypothetical protein
VQQPGAAQVACTTGSKPSTSPIPTAISATRTECEAVNGDFASVTRANASAMRSIRSSPARSTRSPGSQCDTSASASDPQNARSRQMARKASTSAGSNQRPRRCRATRSRIEPPGATVRSDQRSAGHGRDQSASFDVRLAAWSSAPNSAAIRSALAEQPASLGSSA